MLVHDSAAILMIKAARLYHERLDFKCGHTVRASLDKRVDLINGEQYKHAHVSTHSGGGGMAAGSLVSANLV